MLLLSLLFACRSGGEGTPGPVADDEVGCLGAPSVDFGVVAWGKDVTIQVDVPESCGGDVAVEGVEIADPGAPFSVRVLGSPLVEAGGSLPLAVDFDASAGGAFASSIVLSVSGAPAPTILPIAGVVDAPSASAPSSVDFGTEDVGCTATPGVTVRNLGAEPLTLSDAAVDDPDAGFAVSSTFPLVVAPGGSVTVAVAYRPLAAGASNATLTLVTDDPARRTVDVALVGEGRTFDRRTESWPARWGRRLDLLIVVDDSNTMGAYEDALLPAASDIVAALDGTGAEYQIGVISTSSPSFYADPIASTDPNRDQDLAMAILIGATGKGANEALPNVVTTTSKGQDGAQTGKYAFYQPDDLGAVWAITPRDDDGGLATADVLAALYGWTGSKDLVTFGGIVGQADRTGCPGNSEAPTAYEPLTKATGGYLGSICEDWRPTIDELATTSAGWRDRLVPDVEPVPETIAVSVDGQDVTGVTWDGEAIVLPTRVQGDVELAYDAKSTCE